jgi:glycosyltransferase involved in cell wall biosynthesis
MKTISILSYDLSDNCLVRTYPIAKVLQRRYRVEVVGPVFGDSIFAPYRDEFVYKPLYLPREGSRLQRVARGFTGLGWLLDRVTGDVIYAFKPRVTSLGIGLLARCKKKVPLLLDIEDWEAESFYYSPFRSKVVALARLHDPNNIFYNYFIEHLTSLADGITVVSMYLQHRFGGVRLVHGADCCTFDPAKYQDGRLPKERDGSFVILFAGTPRPHKGLEELTQALRIISSPRLCLVVVGHQTEYLRRLSQKYSRYMRCTGPLPHCEMPRLLSRANLVVLPQRDVPVTQAQVPGKIFEAMAMAKPIIATEVSDIPEILDNCGWLVEPESPEALAETIRYVMEHPEEAAAMGERARQRCIEKYSWDAMERILFPLFEKFL